MNIEKQIEFNQIKELWMGLAVTEWAKEKNKGNFFLPVGKQVEETAQGYYGWKKSD